MARLGRSQTGGRRGPATGEARGSRGEPGSAASAASAGSAGSAGPAPVLAVVVAGLLVAGCSAARGAAHGPTSSAAPSVTSAASTPALAGSGSQDGWSVTPVPVPATPTTAQVPLSGWKLTLPVNTAGLLSGTARQLAAASIDAPWLVRGADGSLTFWAPVGGATSADSTHSRTELVATTDFTLGSAVHTLSASLAVVQAPTASADICVGQIHGGGPIKSVPFVLLHWRDGNIVVVVKQVLHGSTAQSRVLLTGVPLGARFEYTIADDGDGNLTLTAAYGNQARKATVRAPSAFMGADVRFQAGDYQQAVGGPAGDGGRVTFYDLAYS